MGWEHVPSCGCVWTYCILQNDHFNRENDDDPILPRNCAAHFQHFPTNPCPGQQNYCFLPDGRCLACFADRDLGASRLVDLSTGKEYGQEEPSCFGDWMCTFASFTPPTCSSTHYRLQTLAITIDIDATSPNTTDLGSASINDGQEGLPRYFGGMNPSPDGHLLCKPTWLFRCLLWTEDWWGGSNICYSTCNTILGISWNDWLAWHFHIFGVVF